MSSYKQSKKVFALAVLSAAALPLSGGALAGTFDTGIPAGWTCSSTGCGALGANGVVTLAPSGGTQYGYVTTVGGTNGVGLAGVSGSTTNGTRLRSSAFSAAASDVLDFRFNYVTSDGAGFADYGWARLLDASLTQVAILFTARTTPSGSVVPGFGMPANAATLIPASAPIIGGGPAWSPLGGSSGACYSSGCGYTGWVESVYTIASAGSYILEFGAANSLDTAFDSGLAFDGITIGGTAIEDVPEPGSLALLGLALAGMAASRRKKQLA